VKCEPRWVFFCGANVPNARKFVKPALSLKEQLDLLKSRGLQIEDEKRVLHYLQHVGYFRLSGYFFHLLNADKFPCGLTFSTVFDHYKFDRELRLLVLDAIERIEVAAKSAIFNHMATSVGAHWFMQQELFSVKHDHVAFLREIESHVTPEERGRVSHLFLDSYFQKYDDPNLPPSWMVAEVLPFGCVSRIYMNLKVGHKKNISSQLDLHYETFGSWTHACSHLRNICAHHSRIWNRKFVITPGEYDLSAPHRHVFDNNNSFYAYAVLMRILLSIIARGTKWHIRLSSLLDKYPHIDKATLGFPKTWKQETFWGFIKDF